MNPSSLFRSKEGLVCQCAQNLVWFSS